MPIPTPRANEAESEFMGRCIRFLRDEGTPQEQAVAICASRYNKEKLLTLEWKRIDRQRSVYSSYAKNAIQQALDTQLNNYINNLSSVALDANMELISTDIIQNAIEKVYSKVMVDFAKNSYDQYILVNKKTESNWIETVLNWVRINLGGIVNSINFFTRRRITEQVEIAIQEGWSIQDLKEKLKKDYAFSDPRAQMIARTEIIRASNAGSLLGAIETGIPMLKFWLATRDDRTRGQKPSDRFDHYSMLEREKIGVPLDQAFNISGEFLLYPGDPDGSAGNTINCRCSLRYEVL